MSAQNVPTKSAPIISWEAFSKARGIPRTTLLETGIVGGLSQKDGQCMFDPQSFILDSANRVPW